MLRNKSATLLAVMLIMLVLASYAPFAVASAPREVSASELQELVASHQGKPLLLVYWASWCMPCRQYKQKLADLRASYPESELEILGVSVDTDKEMLERFLAANELPFKTVMVSGEFYGQIAGTPVPTTVLYGKDGLEQRRLEGNVDERRLNHYVKKLF